MTEKELIEFIDENRKRMDTLLTEMTRLKRLEKTMKDSYITEAAKFKEGDAVNIISEKYSKPRKYFVTKVWGNIDTSDRVRSVKIRYDLETVNGFKPNGGWSLKEDELKLAE